MKITHMMAVISVCSTMLGYAFMSVPHFHYGRETRFFTEMGKVMLNTWDRKIVRKVHGPTTEYSGLEESELI
jgi:hypothetical protein